MSTTSLETFEHAAQQAQIWVKDLDHHLGWADHKRSLRLMRAVLHALRDRLDIHESAQLAAQLPIIIRGLYFEQWRPAASRERHRHLDDFLAEVQASFANDPLGEPATAVRMVFRLLAQHVSPGEIDDVVKSLPEPLRVLWTPRGAVVPPRHSGPPHVRNDGR